MQVFAFLLLLGMQIYSHECWSALELCGILDQVSTVIGVLASRKLLEKLCWKLKKSNFLATLKERTFLQSYMWICMLDLHDVLRNLLLVSVVFHQSAYVQV